MLFKPCHYTCRIRRMQNVAPRQIRQTQGKRESHKLPLKDCNAWDTGCPPPASGQNSSVWQGRCNADCFGLPAEVEVCWQMWVPVLSNSRCSLNTSMTDEPSCKAAWQAVIFPPLVFLIMHIFCSLEEEQRFESQGNHAAPNLQRNLLWYIPATTSSDWFGSQLPSCSPGGGWSIPATSGGGTGSPDGSLPAAASPPLQKAGRAAESFAGGSRQGGKKMFSPSTNTAVSTDACPQKCCFCFRQWNFSAKSNWSFTFCRCF